MFGKADDWAVASIGKDVEKQGNELIIVFVNVRSVKAWSSRSREEGRELVLGEIGLVIVEGCLLRLALWKTRESRESMRGSVLTWGSVGGSVTISVSGGVVFRNVVLLNQCQPNSLKNIVWYKARELLTRPCSEAVQLQFCPLYGQTPEYTFPDCPTAVDSVLLWGQSYVP